VADFGIKALDEVCDILADLQNDAQEEVEMENGLVRPGAPRAIVTAGSLDAHLAGLAAAGLKARPLAPAGKQAA
jgi:hypothetical protein